MYLGFSACCYHHFGVVVFFASGDNQKEDSEEDEDEDPMDAFYPQALGGFIMMLTEDGDMIYLTENVSRHIGITQVQRNEKRECSNWSKLSNCAFVNNK